MKRRLLALSTRPLSNVISQPWKCRRCLVQNAIKPIAGDDFIATSSLPMKESLSSATDLGSSTPHTSTIATNKKQHAVSKRSRGPTFDEQFLREHDQTLTETDRARRRQLLQALKTDIRHDLPPQYLVHINPEALTEKEKEQRKQLYKWGMTGHSNDKGEPKEGHAREVKGVVVSAGKMDRTVKVRVPGQRWEPKIKKYFASYTDHLVNDPNDSLLEGDIVLLHRLRAARTVRYTVGAVIVPYGKPLSERPPIPTPEERLAQYKEARLAKFHRQALRERIAQGDVEAVTELKALGIDETDTIVAQKRKKAGKKGKKT